MTQLLCFLLLSLWSSVTWGQSSSYCRFSSQHTLCINSGLGNACGQQVPARGVDAEDAAKIIAKHNELRSKVAMGQERRGSRGPQPQASNMRFLEWDDELAVVAQSHADQCIFEHECPDCRRVSRFQVGQNLFIGYQSNYDPTVDWDQAIQGWYDEVADFNPRYIYPFQFSSPTGHYTAMVWGNTFKVGCGFTMYQDGGWWTKLYTCNYGPSGNFANREMYSTGSPCSSCPADTDCSALYPGLCEDGDRYDTTKLLEGPISATSAAATKPDNTNNGATTGEIRYDPDESRDALLKYILVVLLRNDLITGDELRSVLATEEVNQSTES